MGKANSNPILDIRTYNVEFEDGDVTEFTANVIAENMYAQCDAEGNQYVLLDKIVDYRKDGHVVKAQDQTTNTSSLLFSLFLGARSYPCLGRMPGSYNVTSLSSGGGRHRGTQTAGCTQTQG